MKKGFFTRDEIGLNPTWEEEWQDMPEFVMEDKTPKKTLLVHFATWEDMKSFAELVGQHLTKTTKYIWFPSVQKESLLDFRYLGDGEEE